MRFSLDIHIGLNLNSAANLELAESGDLNKPESTPCTNNGTSDAQGGSTPNNKDLAPGHETNNESNIDNGVMPSDMESPLISSADVCVGVNEEQGQDSGSVVRPNEAKTRKRVQHCDLEIGVVQNENATSDLGNTANRNDALSGPNKTSNAISSVAASTNSNKKRSSRVFTSSLKSMLSSGSLFRRKSLPRMKKRHLPTQLSVTDTKKTSMSTGTHDTCLSAYN